MEKQVKEKKKVNPKKFYAMFMILMPSILMVCEGMIDNIPLRVIIQGLTFILQAVLVQGILNDYYRE